jgi:hypothetical protein
VGIAVQDSPPMTTAVHSPTLRRGAIAAGVLLLAALTPVLSPSSVVLPAPDTLAARCLGAVALAAAFALGFARPRPAFYALVIVVALEGAVRKWLVNDVVVFVFKDFLTLGIYAAVLPTLSRSAWRRPWWVLVPLGALLALALASCAGSNSFAQAAIGLRAYAIYVPMLWAAPGLLDSAARVRKLLWTLIGVGILESIVAAVQSLTGSQWLNEQVPGVLPATVVTNGLSQLRPTGTMPSVATLATFLLFSVLSALALVAHERRPRPLALTLGALFVLAWGVIYTASRVVFLPSVGCALLLIAYLLCRRRPLAAAGVLASAVAAVLALTYQPFLGGAVREGKDSHVLRTQSYDYIDPSGEVRTLRVTIERGEPKSTAAVAVRGAGKEPTSVAHLETPAGRLQGLGVLRHKSLLGHGTGSNSPGSQYLLEPKEEGAESGYVKVAHELGLIGLVPFVGLLIALWIASGLALLRLRDWRRPAATVAFGAATIIPLLTLISFAVDYPMVALLYYTFTGLALAWIASPALPDREAAARRGDAEVTAQH